MNSFVLRLLEWGYICVQHRCLHLPGSCLSRLFFPPPAVADLCRTEHFRTQTISELSGRLSTNVCGVSIHEISFALRVIMSVQAVRVLVRKAVFNNRRVLHGHSSVHSGRKEASYERCPESVQGPAWTAVRCSGNGREGTRNFCSRRDRRFARKISSTKRADLFVGELAYGVYVCSLYRK